MSKYAWLPVVVAGIGFIAVAAEPEKEVRRIVPLSADGRLIIETERGSSVYPAGTARRSKSTRASKTKATFCATRNPSARRK